MRLPNAERAEVEPAKIEDYLLSRTHPVGRFKAAFFGALGYEAAEWTALRDDLLELARTQDAEPGQASQFGAKYLVSGTLTGRRADQPRSRRCGSSSLARRHHGSSRPTRADAMFNVLDTVVLERDLPDAGLRAGDLGAIVEVYSSDQFEVEFVAASGRTQALVTLSAADLRAVADNDLVAVRPLPQQAAG